jgi:tryptophanyl-tRNA synthetase
MTASLIACGINPERSTLFLQSQVTYKNVISTLFGIFIFFFFLYPLGT